ncbi:MAG: lactate utilization protein [Chloroflexota bacterium]
MNVDERDLAQEQGWYYEALCKKAIDSLKRKNIGAQFAADRQQALARVKEALPAEATIGIGDSMTLHQIGFFDWLESEKGRTVFDPFVRTPDGFPVHSPQQRFETMRKALTSDVFLAGSNAITLDGKIVNMDGRGARVAAMIFGPRKVVLVVGANKIVKDADEAIQRIRTYCAPLNAKRHAMKHHTQHHQQLPCVITGVCNDCNSPGRICHKLVIIDGQSKIPGLHSPGELEGGIQVILVGESLGI